MEYQEENVKRNSSFEVYQSYRKNRLLTIYGILLVLSGTIILALKDLLLDLFNLELSITVIVTGVITLIIGVGLFLFRYLQSGSIAITSDSSSSDRSLRREVENLRLEVLKLRKKGGANFESEEFIDTVNNLLNQSLTEDYIHSKIDGIYSKEAIEKSKLTKLYEDFENLEYRINSEISRLRRSANLNLVIGTLTTTLAIFALGYEVFNGELKFSETLELLSHYVPRLSIIIFIEIFAFFFLKLYKATLDDIKYFNNEKTNIDFKLISLRTAIHQENQDLIKLAIEELVKTERNFKLGKDETTVEVQKLKNESSNNSILIQAINKLTDKL